MNTPKERSSLERLKDLESIDGLPAQLQEAKLLCTHASRADMIAKWAFGKLKTTDGVQSDIWLLLLNCLRLLSPERIGGLLASQDILACSEAFLVHPDAPPHLISSIVAVFRFLLDLSKSTRGSPVEATLRAPAASAASFFGAWLRFAHLIISSDNADFSGLAAVALLSPAVEIWRLRKTQADENQLFAQHCLVPAALLLSSNAMCRSDGRTKRKRNDENHQHVHHGETMLESLLARHIFAAGRAAFWKEPTRSQSVIKGLLNPLHESDQYARILPGLLDIALRCSSTSTLRQRTKEGPWTEELFQAVLTCDLDDGGKLRDLSLLCQLLSKLRKYTTLSKETLKGLYSHYVNLEGGSADVNEVHSALSETATSDNPAMPAMWSFVAELVASDPDIFDESATRYIFSMASKSQQVGKRYIQSLEQSILVPIMKAYAKRRELAGFMDIWSRSTGLDGIANEFSKLVEQSFTEKAFLQQVQKYSDLITSSTSDGGYQSNLGVIFVMTGALLAGVRTQARKDAMFPKLDELLELLLKVAEDQDHAHDIEKSLIKQSSFWNLLTTTFEMWFPTWLSQSHGQELVCKERAELLATGALPTALDAAKPDSVESNPVVARAAGIFVATVCSAFMLQHCECTSDCGKTCSSTVQPLIESGGPFCIDIIARHPGILELVNVEGVNGCLTKSLNGLVAMADGRASDDDRAHVLLQAMRSLATSSAADGHNRTLGCFINVLIEQLRLEDDAKPYSIAVRKDIMLTLLCDFPTRVLSREQREHIIKHVFEDQIASRSWNDSALTNLRMALLVKLMVVPNATCILATDVLALWQLIRSMPTGARQVAEDTSNRPHQLRVRNMVKHAINIEQERMATLILLDELAGLTISHLLATQEQERSQMMLIGIGEQVKTQMQSVQSAADLDGSRLKIQLVKAIVSTLEAGCRPPLKDKLAYHDPGVLGPYLTLLVEEAWTSHDEGDDSSKLFAHPDWIQPALSTLLSTPSNLIPTSAMDTIAKRRQAVIHTALASFEDIAANSDKQREGAVSSADAHGTLSPMVTRYCIGSKYGIVDKSGQYAVLADSILRLPILPPERKTLLDTFDVSVGQLNNLQKIELVQSLLDTAEGPLIGTFELIDICVSRFDDSPSIDGTLPKAQVSLTSLLHAFAGQNRDLARQAASKCIMTILKRKSSVVNQHLVEETLETVLEAVSAREVSSVVYLEACRILATLLLQYRARLRGRYHLVVKVFQAMVAALFQGIDQHGSTNPTITCANRLTRLLILFCEPPHTQQQAKITSLVDEARKEQAYVGQYARYLLHHYCVQVLARTPAEGLREALTPALWSMIEAMEINGADGIKSLSAAMNNSERAVLRGVYDEWRRFGKWRGG